MIIMKVTVLIRITSKVQTTTRRRANVSKVQTTTRRRENVLLKQQLMLQVKILGKNSNI